jgi:hypothetical protein
MAFGTTSAIFVQTMNNPLLRSVDPSNITLPTGYTDLVTDTVKCALFGNSGTPNKLDTMAHIGYGSSGGQWVTANEVTGGGYTAGGVALSSVTYGIDGTATNALAYHAASPSWTGATFTAYGDLVYDASISAGTVADQGICFHSYGGAAETISAATFTVAWYSTGYSSGTVFAITV